MAGIEYEVNPLWNFLQGHYGFEAAFKFFGPYAGASIQVKVVDDYTIESSMDLVMTNTNYVGTHFGGSLYSMCDPFYMFILMKNLGPSYVVWDKAATIRFLRPGRGLVRARFHIDPAEIEEIKTRTAASRKMDWTRTCEVVDSAGKVVASVDKVLYVRLMNQPKI